MIVRAGSTAPVRQPPLKVRYMVSTPATRPDPGVRRSDTRPPRSGNVPSGSKGDLSLLRLIALLEFPTDDAHRLGRIKADTDLRAVNLRNGNFDWAV